MRGRKPTPTTLKILQGNPGRRPLNKQEPKPKIRVPYAPTHLDAGAKAEWRRVVKELRAMGMISLVDRAALAAYCQTYSRWSKAEESLAKVGLLVKTANDNVIQNPLVGIANRSMELMHRFLAEFGMTPSSRTRLKANTEEDDDLDELLFGTSR